MERSTGFSRGFAPASVEAAGLSASGSPPRGEIVWLGAPRPTRGFTARDRGELERWASHEGRRVAWDDDPATFAMLHSGPTPWASWAVTRQDGLIVLWDCVSFADVGRFTSMVEALAAVSGAVCDDTARLSNVVAFRAGGRGGSLRHSPS